MRCAKLKTVWMLLFIFVTTVVVAQKGKNKYDLTYVKGLYYINDPYFIYQDCNRDSTGDDPLVGVSERRCMAIQLLKADSVMQDLYKQMLPTYGSKFKKGQKMWLRYRKSQGEIIWHAYRNGAGYAVGYLRCLLDITNARIGDLRELGGD